MFKDQNQLLKFLAANNWLSSTEAEQIRVESESAKKSPEELIITDNLINEEKLTEIKGKLLKLPAADLKGRSISPKILRIIPQEVADNYQIIAFDQVKSEFSVGFVDPQNFKAVEAVEFLAQKSNLKVKIFIISKSSFKEVFRQYQGLAKEVEEALGGVVDDVFSDKTSLQKAEKLEEVVKGAPVSKMVLVIIRHAIDGRASDIHIEPSATETRVRYRVDGILRTSLVLPRYIHSAIVARIKVLANLKLDETRKPQDGRIRLTIDDRDIDFRVSTLPLYEGEKVVLRILDPSNKIPSLESLGFNKEHINLIKEGIKRPHGLFLLTGPTGSGKTTTLYTVLSMLNQDGNNIVTLEDPIEYYIAGINQSQIEPEIEYNFVNGLRSILRQDPNIIMLGEIRDEETTKLVIHASLTGHMVLSTLHTNDAVGAIPRLIDLGAEPFLLSSVINTIMAQRLARKICPDCKKEFNPPADMIKRIKSQLSTVPEKYLAEVDVLKLTFWKGEGCAHCGNLGYQGRIAAAEIINITPKLREIINRGAKVGEIEAELKNQGFITLTQDCLIKAMKGITTLDEVVRVSQL